MSAVFCAFSCVLNLCAFVFWCAVEPVCQRCAFSSPVLHSQHGRCSWGTSWRHQTPSPSPHSRTPTTDLKHTHTQYLSVISQYLITNLWPTAASVYSFRRPRKTFPSYFAAAWLHPGFNLRSISSNVRVAIEKHAGGGKKRKWPPVFHRRRNGEGQRRKRELGSKLDVKSERNREGEKGSGEEEAE